MSFSTNEQQYLPGETGEYWRSSLFLTLMILSLFLMLLEFTNPVSIFGFYNLG